MVDNEVSLQNTDGRVSGVMKSVVWNGPWMPHIYKYFPDPKLLSVEVHRQGDTSQGAAHVDHAEHQIFLVSVPLSESGNRRDGCGGTTVIDPTGTEHSLECDANRFVIFPGHWKHWRQASVSEDHAKMRRTLFITFADKERLPLQFMRTARATHSKLKNAARDASKKRTLTCTALDMTLRSAVARQRT